MLLVVGRNSQISRCARDVSRYTMPPLQIIVRQVLFTLHCLSFRAKRGTLPFVLERSEEPCLLSSSEARNLAFRLTPGPNTGTRITRITRTIQKRTANFTNKSFASLMIGKIKGKVPRFARNDRLVSGVGETARFLAALEIQMK